MRPVFEGEKSVHEALSDAQAKASVEMEKELLRRAEAEPADISVVNEQPDTNFSGTTISFLPMDFGSGANQYNILADLFHETNPNIIVNIQPPDNFTTGLEQLAAQADCFQFTHIDTTVEELKNQVLALGPFFDSDKTIVQDDFIPFLMEQYTLDGTVWAIPSEAQPYTIEFNKDLFDAVGLDYPSEDWSVEEFLSLAKALTSDDEDNMQYGFVGVSEMLDLLIFFELLGGQLLDDNDPPAASFNDPASVEAMQWFVDLYLSHAVKPIISSNEEQSALVVNNRAAIWSSLFPSYDDDRFGALPLPQSAFGKFAPLVYTGGYFISADSDAPQACWEWITFLSEQITVSQGMPARRSIVFSAEFAQQVGAERATVYRKIIEGDAQLSIVQRAIDQEWLAPYMGWLDQAYWQIIEKEFSTEQALAEAQTAADEYYECLLSNGVQKFRICTGDE